MGKLDSDFKHTCKLLFGKEIGELSDFEQYFKQGMFPSKSMRSMVSGKGVLVSSPHYPEGAKYVSQDEVGKLSSPAFGINDIKDVDSLFRAAQENAVFCGNKMFGKNMNTEEVDNCADCIEVLHSHNITNTKYAAYCSVGRDSNSIYGVHFFKNVSHSLSCMHCLVRGVTRCFECYCTTGISDSYYTLNCSGCSNCIFCFNLRSKNYAIGNLQLSKERYLELKEKLVMEMADILRKKKRIFSIADLFPKENSGKSSSGGIASEREEIPEFAKADFAATAKIVLSKPHDVSGRTASWLSKRMLEVRRIERADGTAYWVDLPVLGKIPASCLVSLQKALDSGKNHIEIPDDGIPSLSEVRKRVEKIAVSSLEVVEGQVQNCVDCVSRFDSASCYKIWAATGAKHSAFHTAVTESEYIFGGYFRTLYSRFCIDCDNVTSVSNCFGCDSCYSCRNCYFCHNCEKVEEGIFCFNLKGARYAVLNREVSQKEYKQVKRLLLDYVNSEIEKKGGLDFDIFDIGTGKYDIGRAI
ncbi:MAG: hypothetical protein PHS02_01715 [Candidatus ainarchaeum sp.]|nr:hypothetical protein [Candidatus ainarchaeum sp.]